jgi:hypothetical protein
MVLLRISALPLYCLSINLHFGYWEKRFILKSDFISFSLEGSGLQEQGQFSTHVNELNPINSVRANESNQQG